MKRWDDDYVGKKVLEVQLPRKRGMGKTKEEIFGRGEGGHAGGRTEII